MRNYSVCILLGVATLLLLLANMAFGSVSIPVEEVFKVLCGGDASRDSWTYIILESRLPQTITALLAGSSLAVAGLMMQTIFENPLAGPSVLGITNGASLGVAIVMLLTGGTIGAGSALQIGGLFAVIIGAFFGAMAVMGILLAFSSMLRTKVMLLIVGIMIGYLSSSVISLLNYFSTSDNVHSYVMWGMGSFSDVTLAVLPWFSGAIILSLMISAMLVKPLNALLLGDNYAESLGFNIRRTRTAVLLSSGLLTAIVTAFCGPVAFIGLAVPHIARMMTQTSKHQVLMPATVLCGACIALLCNIVCILPENIIMPVNAVTPLFGAPIIIYIIAKR